MSRHLVIRADDVEGFPFLHLQGRFDGDAFDPLRTRLLQLMDEGRRFVGIDCRRIKWMPSIGYGALLACSMLARKAKGTVAVVVPPHSHFNVFSVPLPQFCFDQMDDAVAYLRDQCEASKHATS